MSDQHTPGGDPEREHDSIIQVDLYGIKIQGRPSAPKEPVPRDWTEVWPSVRQSLLRLATEPLALLADTFTTARRLLTGVAELPAALAKRISASHHASSVAEQQAETLLPNVPGYRQLTQSEALEQLEGIFARLRAQGFSIQLQQIPGGQVMLSITHPRAADLAHELANEAMSEFQVNALLASVAEREILDGPITCLSLPGPIQIHLQAAGMLTVRHLVAKTRTQLLNLGLLDAQMIDSIEAALQKHSLRLAI